MNQDILDEIEIEYTQEHKNYLKNIWRYVSVMLLFGGSALLIMTFTANAETFSKMIGTTENIAFVMVISSLIVGIIALGIVIYKIIRYRIAKWSRKKTRK